MVSEALIAGKELDALVAERVMGIGKHLTRHGSGGICPAVLPYSTDIAVAWLVVEHLVHGGWKVEVILVRRTSEDARTGEPLAKVTIEREGVRVRKYEDTAPLAICLAALEACS